MSKKMTKISSLLLALLLVLTALVSPVVAEEASEDRVELLARDAEWFYLDDGNDLGANWAESVEYADWAKGASPLGFGDDFSETNPEIALATEVSYGDDENDKHMTTYFATEVEIPAITEPFVGVEVYVHVDDGAVVYLNGKELFRRGIDEGVEVAYTTGAKFKPKEETFVIMLDELKDILVDGKNVIAAEVHQDDGGSSDLWFEMGLVVVTEAGMEKPIDWSVTPLPNPEVEVDKVSRVVMNYNGDPATRMGFTWYTNQASVGSNLEVVAAEEGQNAEDANFDEAMKFEGEFKGNSNAPEFLYHKAVAEGLEAGKTYFFRVGDAELDLWSEVGSFTTDDKEAGFSFINLADAQAKTEEEAELAADTIVQAYKTATASEFFILNGDVVDTGSKEEQWVWLFDNATEALLNLPFMAVAGNHEEDPHSFIEHFNVLPAEGSSTVTGAYYSFDYDNTHFIMLNNNESTEEFNNFTPRQLAWMEADSKAAKERGVDWQIVVMHKGPYTTSNHATDEDIYGEAGVRTLVAPKFAELGIDLVIQGHDHIYAVSKPIGADNKVVETELRSEEIDGVQADFFQAPEGVVYVIPSTCGPKVYYKNKDAEEIEPGYYEKFLRADEHAAAKYATEEDEKRPPRSIIQNFFEVNVQPESITITVYEIDRNQDGTPVVVDIIGIEK